MSFQNPKFTEEAKPLSPQRRRFFQIVSIVALAVPGSRTPPDANTETIQTEIPASSATGIVS